MRLLLRRKRRQDLRKIMSDKNNYVGGSYRGIRRFSVDDACVQEYIPLLRHMLKTRKYGSNLTYDEKFAVGLVAIAVALQQYDPAKHDRPAWWVAFHIDVAVREESRKTMRENYNVIFHPDPFCFFENRDEPAYRDDECDLERREERQKTSELAAIALEEIRALPERDRKIVTAIALEHKTHAAVAKELGVAQSWVSRLYCAAIKHLRYRLYQRRPDLRD